MLKIYCPSCGACHQYSHSKPNFCSKCGTNLIQSNLNKIKPSIAQELISSENLDEDIDVLRVPKINNLEVEISKSQLISEKVSDIMKSSPEEEYEDFKSLVQNSENYGKINNEKFLEDFAIEAGALKPKTREHKQNGKKE